MRYKLAGDSKPIIPRQMKGYPPEILSRSGIHCAVEQDDDQKRMQTVLAKQVLVLAQSHLTTRQYEALDCYAQGFTLTETAEALGVCLKRAEHLEERALRKIRTVARQHFGSNPI